MRYYDSENTDFFCLLISMNIFNKNTGFYIANFLKFPKQFFSLVGLGIF